MLKRILTSLVARIKRPMDTWDQIQHVIVTLRALKRPFFGTLSAVAKYNPKASDSSFQEWLRKECEATWFGPRSINQNEHFYADSRYHWKEGFEDETSKVELLAKVHRHSMVSHRGALSLVDIAEHVEATGINGAFVEMGCWRGGMSALMAMAAPSRHVWLFDSFEGLPNLRSEDFNGDFEHAMRTNSASGELSPIGALVADIDEAREVMLNIAGHPEEQTHFVKGWFQDTLPETVGHIGDIALLRLDGDLYESYNVCFEYLWDLVIPGGFIVVDDYCLAGCQQAVHEFFDARKIKPYMHNVDFSIRVIEK